MEQGITQLYTPPGSSPDQPDGSQHTGRALILKRLAKSLLLNFLELIGILSTNPQHQADKVQDIRTMFINFHHLLNEYRPHQARESLILMMEDQLSHIRAETRAILEAKAETERVLASLGKLETCTNQSNDNMKALSDVEDYQRIWQAIEKECD